MRAASVAVAILALAAGVTNAMAQADPPRRAPPRVIVTPPAATIYPVRGVAYPGPGFVRDCVARLIPEYRPSGTVIVPHTYCRWVRGRS
jgi:hypothetical protein